jgi:hypothetical protein
MKNAYATPVLVVSGDAVGTTLGGEIKSSVESTALNTRPSTAGSVGFNL